MIIDGLPGGGAEKVVLTLAQGMAEQGHDVTLLSLRDVCDYPIPAGVHYHLLVDRCQTPWRKLRELTRRARSLDNALARMAPFDVIFSHLHKTDRIVSRSRRLDFQRTWFCLHGVFSVSYLGGRRGFSYWLKRHKIRRIYQSRNLLAVSQGVLQDLRTVFAVTPARTAVIPNPFDTAAIRRTVSTPDPMPDQPYLLHVGRFHPFKRHDRLIRAWAASGIDLPLVLLGQGSPEAIKKVEALAGQLQVRDRLVLPGFTPNPYPWIAHARLLILSSDCEGFGNVLVEALLTNTPVVSTRCPGGPVDILTGDLARGLADMSVESLAAAMNAVLRSPPVIDQQKLDCYDTASIVQRYLQLAEQPTR